MQHNQDVLAILRQKLEQAIQASEDTLSIPVRRIGRVSGRILPMTSLYYMIEEPVPITYVIDGMSQHGQLTLVDIPSLIQGEGEHLYQQQLGTYTRDGKFIDRLYLNIVGKDVEIEHLFFGQQILDHMIEQGIIHVVEE